MSEIFISYARSTEPTAKRIAEALRALGYGVWRDDELPAHRAYAEAIEERLRSARAVLVLWSAEAAKSQWVRAEADVARQAGVLVQASLDGAPLPLPFNQIQCADLRGWTGAADAGAWRRIVDSVAELVGRARPPGPAPAPPADAGLGDSDRLSIAVLPFANLTRGEDEALLADGVVDEIVTALSRFPALTVVASRTSLAYRGDARPAADIARALGVRFLIDGTVRRAGDKVRVSVKLADAPAGAQVWAEQFDGPIGDVYALQDEIGLAAAARVVPAIEATCLRRALEQPAQTLTAYELFLRAVHLERAFTREALEEAIAVLDLALARDAHSAQALSFSSLLHSLLVLNGWADDPAAVTRRALDLGRQALSTGTDDPDSLARVATVLIWVGEDAGPADAMVERALARNPGASLVWFASAWIKTFDGRPALGLEHWETHLRLDPRSPLYAFVAGGVGVCLALLGRFEEAAIRLQECVQIVPDHRPLRGMLVAVLAHLGRRDEAARTLAGLPPEVIPNVLGLLRRSEDRELIREGLRLAGAQV